MQSVPCPRKAGAIFRVTESRKVDEGKYKSLSYIFTLVVNKEGPKSAILHVLAAFGCGVELQTTRGPPF